MTACGSMLLSLFSIVIKNYFTKYLLLFVRFFQVLFYIHRIHFTETPMLIFSDYRFMLLKGLRISDNFHIYYTLLNLGKIMLTKRLQIYTIRA